MTKSIRWVLIAIVLTTVATLAIYAAFTSLLPGGLMKMVPCTGYLILALLCGAHRSVYGRILFFGLCLGWVGDAFFIYTTWPAFHAGLMVFIMGHAVYGAAFLSLGCEWRRSLAALVALALPIFLVTRFVWPGVPDYLQIPVVNYVVMITLMFAMAIGVGRRPGGKVIMAGALSFYLSDIGVALMFFKYGLIPPIAAPGMFLYVGGQSLLALSIAYVESPALGAKKV